MQRILRYSKKAIKDIQAIGDYIEFELCNPSAAAQIVQGITKKIDNLLLFPEIGSKVDFGYEMEYIFRYVKYNNYMAFYQLEKEIIYIDRVMYAKREYIPILSKYNST